MYLASLAVQNFRCLRDVRVTFQPGLNVVLGENNTGKTALLDAIRLVLGLGTDRREIYLSEDDLFHDASGQRASHCLIEATLRGLAEAERGGFSTCLAPSLGDDAAIIHVRGDLVLQGQKRRFRFRAWGGEMDGESIPPETLEGVRSVHLEALRDPRTGLRPGRMSRLARAGSSADCRGSGRTATDRHSQIGQRPGRDRHACSNRCERDQHATSGCDRQGHGPDRRDSPRAAGVQADNGIVARIGWWREGAGCRRKRSRLQ